MNNIEEFIITCESLMIGEDEIVMEGTIVDAYKVMAKYQGQVANLQNERIVAMKKDKERALILIEKEITLLREFRNALGNVDESTVRNNLNILNFITIGAKLSNTKKIQNIIKSDGGSYQQKGIGSWFKQSNVLVINQNIVAIEKIRDELKKEVDVKRALNKQSNSHDKNMAFSIILSSTGLISNSQIKSKINQGLNQSDIVRSVAKTTDIKLSDIDQSQKNRMFSDAHRDIKKMISDLNNSKEVKEWIQNRIEKLIREEDYDKSDLKFKMVADTFEHFDDELSITIIDGSQSACIEFSDIVYDIANVIKAKYPLLKVGSGDGDEGTVYMNI